MGTAKLNNDEKSLELFREKIKDKCLMDDKFMSVVFRDFPEGVELVLRIILEIPDLVVNEATTQVTMTNLLGRTVRIDVFATDSNGVSYNIEIQKAKEGAGFKRARYHSSMLDADDPAFIGENFDALARSFVIFICETDFIGAGKPLYRIERRIAETGELFDDEATIIYVNGDNKDGSTELGRLIQDFFNPDPDTMNNKLLADRSRRYKTEEEGIEMVRELLTEEEWDAAEKSGIEKGFGRGVSGMIQENLDENVPTERIIVKLGKYYGFSREEAIKLIEDQKSAAVV